jgi:hypothetical protein
MTRRPPRWLPLVLAMAAVFGGGLATGARLGETTREAPPPISATDPLPSESGTAAHDVEVDNEPATPAASPTRESAVRAAAAFTVAFDGAGLLDPGRRAALLDDYAARGSRQELGRSLGEVALLVGDQLHLAPEDLDDPGFVWRSVPAGWKIETFTHERAVVSIWGTGVVVARGLPLVQPGWRTTRVELRWERDAWRLVAFRSEPGPEPPPVGGTPDASVQARLINAYQPLHRLQPLAGSGR